MISARGPSVHLHVLFACALLGSAVVGLGMLSAAADRGGDRGGLPAPLALFTWVTDLGVPPDAGDDAVNVLAQSWTLLNPSVLAQIDPALADVEEMPLVSVQLFSDVAFTAQVISARSLWMDVEPWNDTTGIDNPPDAFILSARVLTPQAGYLVLHSSAEGVFARMHIDGEGSFDLAPDKGPLYTARHITSTNEFECLTGANAAEEPTGDGGAAGSTCPGPPFDPCDGACDDGCTIDLVVLFTTKAKDEATAANPPKNIQTEILLAIEEANQACVNSRILAGTTPLKLRPVFVGEAIGYTEVVTGPGTGSCSCLAAVPPLDCSVATLSPQYMLGDISNPHLNCASILPYLGIRDAIRADLVGFVLRKYPGPIAISTFMEDENALNEHRGFAVSPWDLIGTGNWVLAHELGHCMGAGHACNNAFCPPPESCAVDGQPVFPCSYAKLFTVGATNYATIMRSPNDGLAPGTIVVNHFSNPAVLYLGVPTGSAGCRENAPTINDTRDTVAAYRKFEIVNKNRVASADGHPGFVLGNANSATPAMSATARYVVSATLGTNFGVAEGNTGWDIIRWDRQTDNLIVLSLANASTTADRESTNPAISGDGGTVAWGTTSDNIVPLPGGVCDGGAPCVRQIIISDASYDGDFDNPDEVLTRSIVSYQHNSLSIISNGACDYPSLSFDGLKIAYHTAGTNVVTPDLNGTVADIVLRNRATNQTTRLSVNDTGLQADGPSERPSLSPDATTCSFQSKGTNLDPLQPGSAQRWDIYLRRLDILPETTRRVSIAIGGQQPNGDSINAALAVDAAGTIWIVYESTASNLISTGDSGTFSDIYLYNVTTGVTTLVSRSPITGVSANGHSTFARISPDGRFVTFISDATDLVTGVSTVVKRVYLYDRLTGTITLVSKRPDGTPSAEPSDAPAIGNFAHFIAFESDDQTLVDGLPSTEPRHVFIRNLGGKGDLSGDGRINDIDRAILSFNWGQSCSAADLTGDGTVDGADLGRLLLNWTG